MAREVPLSAAIGCRVSAASSGCAVAAVAREIGAETANTNAFLPQSTGGFAQALRKGREKGKGRLNRRGAENAERRQSVFDTNAPRESDTTIRSG